MEGEIKMTKNREDYNPTPVYNRKYARNVIRAQILKTRGQHNVSALMSDTFRDMRNRSKEVIA